MRVYFEQCDSHYIGEPREQFHAYWEYDEHMGVDYVKWGIAKHFLSVHFYSHSMGVNFNFVDPADEAAFTLLLESGAGLEI